MEASIDKLAKWSFFLLFCLLVLMWDQFVPFCLIKIQHLPCQNKCSDNQACLCSMECVSVCASLSTSHPSCYDTNVLLGKVGIYHDSNPILIPVRVRASFLLEEVWYDCFQWVGNFALMVFACILWFPTWCFYGFCVCVSLSVNVFLVLSSFFLSCWFVCFIRLFVF